MHKLIVQITQSYSPDRHRQMHHHVTTPTYHHEQHLRQYRPNSLALVEEQASPYSTYFSSPKSYTMSSNHHGLHALGSEKLSPEQHLNHSYLPQFNIPSYYVDRSQHQASHGRSGQPVHYYNHQIRPQAINYHFHPTHNLAPVSPHFGHPPPLPPRDPIHRHHQFHDNEHMHYKSVATSPDHFRRSQNTHGRYFTVFQLRLLLNIS